MVSLKSELPLLKLLMPQPQLQTLEQGTVMILIVFFC